jgi:hypothetical protein
MTFILAIKIGILYGSLQEPYSYLKFHGKMRHCRYGTIVRGSSPRVVIRFRVLNGHLGAARHMLQFC